MLELPRRRGRVRIPSFCVLGLSLVVEGCRFSETAVDPLAEAPLSGAKGGAGGRGTGGSTGTGGTDETGGTVGTGATVGTGDTGGTGDSGGTDTGGTGDTGGADTGATGGDSGNDGSAGGDTGGGGTSGSEGGMPPTPGACQPATAPAICDPVKNLGCLVPFSFCDIDSTQVVATGRCVFPWTSTPPPAPLPDGGGSCFVDATTDTCVATSTCVQGSCRKLCYCDSDCQPGDCCTEPAPGSSTTFKLCKPC
jgi:hypothetical protein